MSGASRDTWRTADTADWPPIDAFQPRPARPRLLSPKRRPLGRRINGLLRRLPASVAPRPPPPLHLWSHGKLTATRGAFQTSKTSNIFPGFKIPYGSSASFTAFIAFTCAGECCIRKNGVFASPMPCSPEIAPPSATTFLISASTAFSAARHSFGAAL